MRPDFGRPWTSGPSFRHPSKEAGNLHRPKGNKGERCQVLRALHGGGCMARPRSLECGLFRGTARKYAPPPPPAQSIATRGLRAWRSMRIGTARREGCFCGTSTPHRFPKSHISGFEDPPDQESRESKFRCDAHMCSFSRRHILPPLRQGSMPLGAISTAWLALPKPDVSFNPPLIDRRWNFPEGDPPDA